MELPVRKLPRHPKYDYSTPGYYFVTLCTQNRAALLGRIVGPDAPGNRSANTEHPGGCSLQAHMEYSPYGEITRTQLEEMASFYPDIRLEKYVVMPNHIHLLLHISGDFPPDNTGILRKNYMVSRFAGTFKRFCSRKIGSNIWQTSFHDHIIRNEPEYQKIWMYIETNPLRWEKDCFCSGS